MKKLLQGLLWALVLQIIGLGAVGAQTRNRYIESIKQVETPMYSLRHLYDTTQRSQSRTFALDTIGDLDGDGIPEVVQGMPNMIDTFRGSGNWFRPGSVLIHFFKADGSIRKSLRIGNNSGNFKGQLSGNGSFGHSVGAATDINKDGIPDLLVSQPGGHYGRGNVWVLFMDTSGQVKDHRIINDSATTTSHSGASFGRGVISLGDMNADGFNEIVVGFRSFPSVDSGGFFVLSIDTGAHVRKEKVFYPGHNGFRVDGNIQHVTSNITAVGDLNKDGIPDFAISNIFDRQEGHAAGAFRIIALDTGRNIIEEHKYGGHYGNLSQNFRTATEYTQSIVGFKDLDGNGQRDLVVGSYNFQTNPTVTTLNDNGAMQFLMLDTNLATAICEEYVTERHGGFNGSLGGTENSYGMAICNLGDIDNNGTDDMLAYNPAPDTNWGQLYFHFMAKVKLAANKGIITPDTNMCSGETIRLRANSYGYGYWFDHLGREIQGDSIIPRTALKSDSIFYYKSTSKRSNCPAYVDTLRINLKKRANFQLHDYEVCNTNVLKLGHTIAYSNLDYTWNQGSVLSNRKAALPFGYFNATRQFKLSLESQNGCEWDLTQKFTFTGNGANCKGNTILPKDRFAKILNGGVYDAFEAVTTTRDNHILVLGTTKSYGSGGNDLVLLKLDADGEVIWIRTFGSSSYERGIAVIEDKDGNYVITGQVGSNVIGLWKINSNGTRIRNHGHTNGGIPRGLVQLETGDYEIITQRGSEIGFYKFGNNAWFWMNGDRYVKRNGSRTYKFETGDLCLSQDKRTIVAVGQSRINGTEVNAMMIIAHTSGDTIAVRSISSNKDTRFHDVTRGADGHYVALGYSIGLPISGSSTNNSLDFFAVKFRENGSVIWSKTYGNYRWQEEGRSVLSTLDGGYLFAGMTTYSGSLNARNWLITKVDSQGIVQWSRIIGDSGQDSIRTGGALAQMADGSYLVAGSFIDANNDKVASLIKITPDGKTFSCLSDTFPMNIGSHSLPVVKVQLDRDHNYTGLTSIPNPQTPSSYTFDDNCDPVYVKFRADSLCAYNPTYFYDESDSRIQSWWWEVYDTIDLKLIDTSSLQNPNFQLAKGKYYVDLAASDGVDTIHYTRKINIISPTITKSIDTTICQNDTVQLEVTGRHRIQWLSNYNISDTAGYKPNVWPYDTTDYVFQVLDTLRGCITQDTISIDVIPAPSLTLNTPSIKCPQDTTQILLTSTGNFTYQWAPRTFVKDYTAKSPLAFPDTSTWFTVQMTDLNGCRGVDSTMVTVRPDARITPPMLRCVDPISQSILRLHWDTSAFDTMFSHYLLYRSAYGLPFTQMDSIGQFASFAKNDSNATDNDSLRYRYFLQIVNRCGAAGPPSDTVENTRLSYLRQSDKLNRLSWNDNKLGENPQYYIYENSGSGYSLTDSTRANFWYRNTCGNSSRFAVTRIDSLIGCSSVSNSVLVNNGDTTPPPPVDLINASVESHNQVNLRIRSSSAKDLMRYRLFRSISGAAYLQIDSFGPLSGSDTLYADQSINPATNTYAYQLKALDSCGNVGDFGTIHQPHNLSVSAGNLRAELNWTKYQGYNLNGTSIQRWNGAAWQTIHTITNSDTSYTDMGLACNVAYFYRLKSTENSGNSQITYSDSGSVTIFDTVAPSSTIYPSSKRIRQQPTAHSIQQSSRNRCREIPHLLLG